MPMKVLRILCVDSPLASFPIPFPLTTCRHQTNCMCGIPPPPVLAPVYSPPVTTRPDDQLLRGSVVVPMEAHASARGQVACSEALAHTKLCVPRKGSSGCQGDRCACQGPEVGLKEQKWVSRGRGVCQEVRGACPGAEVGVNGGR